MFNDYPGETIQSIDQDDLENIHEMQTLNYSNNMTLNDSKTY